MSWRRFGILLNGLSPRSALAHAIGRRRRGEEVNELRTPAQAERAFRLAFGPPGSGEA